MANLSLVDYSSDSEEDDITQYDTSEKIVMSILINDILKPVVEMSEFVIDPNPSFDVYRSRKRMVSECSSVLTADPSSSSESSESEESTTDSDSDSSIVELKPVFKKPLKVKGEMTNADLPPIEELTITVPEEKCYKIGSIKSCIQDLVLVESMEGLPALDLDSVLFLEKGHRSLGRIFDVIGQVDLPFYCVRFNSADHIKSKEISPGLPVYYAPETEHTNYIFVEQLKRLKGTDASWKHDHELTSSEEEFSDDEAEVQARQRKAYKPPNKDVRSGNAFFRQKASRSQQQQPPHQQQSSFYRSNKRNRAQDYGPIQWNSSHTSGWDFSRPPPNAPSMAMMMPPPTNTVVQRRQVQQAQTFGPNGPIPAQSLPSADSNPWHARPQPRLDFSLFPPPQAVSNPPAFGHPPPTFFNCPPPNGFTPNQMGFNGSYPPSSNSFNGPPFPHNPYNQY